MAASARFLSAITVAFVAGVVSTSAYISHGVARREDPGPTQGAAPSLAERLRAEARGQSLPWSDPVEAASMRPASRKLQFAPGPARAPAEVDKPASVAEKSPGQQVEPASVRFPDEGRARSQVRLADPGRRARPAPSVTPSEEGTAPGSSQAPRRALDEGGALARARSADASQSTPKPRPVPFRNLPSLDAADEAPPAARKREPRRARLAAPGPDRPVRLAQRDDLDDGAPLPRRAREARADAPDWASEREPRARLRGSVAASDGLMRWLSGPGGRF